MPIQKATETHKKPLNGFCVRLAHFYRASADCAVARCLSVCLSVTGWYSVETAKLIRKLFSPSGSHMVFPYQTLWQMAIFRRGPPNGDVECEFGWGYEKIAIFDQYLALSGK